MVAGVIILAALLLSAAAPASALSNAYCSAFQGAGVCPPCRPFSDPCSPVDIYWTNPNYCMPPDTPDVARCGPVATYDMVSAADRTTLAGTVTAFQTADNFLLLTFNMYCPYTLRPGYSSEVPYNLGAYVWNTTDLMGTMQYADPFFNGLYTCYTMSIDLTSVCDPGRSAYTTAPFASINRGCGCFSNTRPCPPSDFRTSRMLVVQPSLYTVASLSTCRPASGAPLTRFMARTDDGSGLVQWDAAACGPVGTELDPSRFPRPPPPKGTRSDQLPSLPPPMSPAMPFPPPSPPPPSPPPPSPPPPSPPPPSPPPPTPPPPSPPPPSPPPPNPPPPSPPPPSPPPPSPPPPSPPPPTPPPPSPPPPLPPPPSPPPPSPSPPPPPPAVDPSPPPSPPPPPPPSPPPTPTHTPITSGEQSNHTAPSISPPPALAPPQPAPPAVHHSSTAGKQFMTATGIGLLAGGAAFAAALCCCCGITAYVFCRRANRDASSADGDSAADPDALPHHCDGDDQSLTNFSFAMPKVYDGKEQQYGSSDGGLAALGGHGGDMEKGLYVGPDGSGGSGSGSGGSHSGASRPLSSHSDGLGMGLGPQVFMELEPGGGGRGSDPRELLHAHAAAAAAMGAHARLLAAMGGAAATPAGAVEMQARRGGSRKAPGLGAVDAPLPIHGSVGGPPQLALPAPPPALQLSHSLEEPGAVATLILSARASLPASPGATAPPLTHGSIGLPRGAQQEEQPQSTLQARGSSALQLASSVSAAAVAAAAAGVRPPGSPGGEGVEGSGSVISASPSSSFSLSARASANGGGRAGGSAATAPTLPLPPIVAPATPAGAGGKSRPGSGGSSPYPSVYTGSAAAADSTSFLPPPPAAATDGGAASGKVAANPYPSLFSNPSFAPQAALAAIVGANSGSFGSSVGGSRGGSLNRPPPLVSIPSFGPLHLPESTFATHAPLNLDEEDDEAGVDAAATAAARPMLPYGSLPSPAALAHRSSSSVASAVTLYSPSLANSLAHSSSDGRSMSMSAAATAAAAALSEYGSEPACPPAGTASSAAAAQTAVAADAASGGARPGSPRVPDGPSPFAGARVQQLAVLSPPQSPPSSAGGDGDEAFSFRSGSVGAAGDAALSRADSAELKLPPAAALFSGGALSFTSAKGRAAAGSGPGGGGGSPLRGAASVGGAPSTPSPQRPLPLTSSLQTTPHEGQAGRSASSPPSPLRLAPPPPYMPSPAGAGSAGSGSSTGTGPAAALQLPPPPPPPHLQPLVGPHGSVLRPPQPAALQPRTGLASPPPAASGSGTSSPSAAAAAAARARGGSSPLRSSTGSLSASPTGYSSPPGLSPAASLHHAHSGACPHLPTATSLASAASLASASSTTSPPSSRYPSLHTVPSAASAAAAASLRSAGSLPAPSSSFASSSTASMGSWGSGGGAGGAACTAGAAHMDLAAIRRACSGADGGLAAAVGGCDGGGEDLPLAGAPGDGLAAVYNAVCRLEPGTLFCNKYKIRDCPHLGRNSVVLLAKNVYSKARVAIKFHADRRQYEREKEALRQLSSQYVPALEEPLEGPSLSALGLPPCLVMEAGRCTLAEWLRDQRPDTLAQKNALHQVLGALLHLHTHRLVHRDVKPANIMWFDEAHRFKLIDLAESAAVGEAAPPCCTPLYSPPEQVKAALDGACSAAAVTPAADMWAYGVVAYEVLSGGSRFYGPSPRLSEVLEAVFGHRPLPTEGGESGSGLAGVELSQARRLIANLVVRAPGQRWSAATAHRNALFSTGDDTDQRAAKWDSMLSRISEVQQVVATTTAEMRTAQLAINLTICEAAAAPASPGSSPGRSASGRGLDRLASTASYASGASALSGVSGASGRLRHMDSSRISRRCVHKEVPMTCDDCLPGEPIFMMLLGKSYAIRITVAHAKGMRLDIEGIRHLRITTPDNMSQLLPVRLEKGLRDGCYEFVAEWEPAASRSRHLTAVTATEGPIQRRVVFLNAELVLELGGGAAPMAVNAMLYCVMEQRSLRYKMAQFRLWSSDRWSQAPQWMRDVAKGTMVLVRVAGNVVGV